MKLIINTDGLSKGNPGRGAIGAILRDTKGLVVATVSQSIGMSTNNEAEYKALIASLQKAVKLGCKQVEIRSDSELMVNQIKGLYKIKSVGLRPLYLEACTLLNRFESVSICHVPREQNTEADALANDALKK